MQPPADAVTTGPSRLASAARNILILKCLERVYPEFQRAGVPFLVLKGASFIGGEYPDPGERIVTDLDLLVGRRDFGKAQTLLGAMGARPLEDGVILHEASYERLLYLPVGGLEIAVDVHHAFAHPAGFAIDYARVFRDAQPHPLADLGRLGVRRPSPEHALVGLALHQLYEAFGTDWRNYEDAERILSTIRVDREAFAHLAGRWGVRTVLYFFLARGRAVGIITRADAWIAALQPSSARRAILRRCVDESRRDPFLWSRLPRHPRQALLFFLLADRVRPLLLLPAHLIWVVLRGRFRTLGARLTLAIRGWYASTP